jgi:copper(I)-binding protein
MMMTKYKTRLSLLALATSLCSLAAQAQVQVQDAWVRATVAQQKATGAFMKLTAASDLRLVSASSPAVPMVEVHEMAMEGSVMKMRQIQALDLPAGKTVELKPGGYHVMLMGLTQAMPAGSKLPLSLVFEDKAGKRQTVEVSAEVRAINAAAKKADAAADHKH